MASIKTEPFQTPPLLTLLCAMAAMTFIVAVVRWLWLMQTGRQSMALNRKVWMFQFYNFLNILVISVLNGWFSQTSDKTVGEAVVLVSLAVGVGVICKIHKRPLVRTWLRHAKTMLFLFLACVAGWVATIFLGWCVHLCVALFAGAQAGQYVILAPMIAGMSWIALVFGLYQGLPPDQKKQCRIRDVLTPVMLAYMVLVVPLYIQNVANSKGWQEMRDRRPPFRRA